MKRRGRETCFFFLLGLIVCSLSFSPSIDKPRTCKMSSDLSASIRLQTISGLEINKILKSPFGD